MKFVERRPFTDPDVAARKLIEIANAVEAVQDGRVHIEKINEPFQRLPDRIRRSPGACDCQGAGSGSTNPGSM